MEAWTTTSTGRPSIPGIRPDRRQRALEKSAVTTESSTCSLPPRWMVSSEPTQTHICSYIRHALWMLILRTACVCRNCESSYRTLLQDLLSAWTDALRLWGQHPVARQSSFAAGQWPPKSIRPGYLDWFLHRNAVPLSPDPIAHLTLTILTITIPALAHPTNTLSQSYLPERIHDKCSFDSIFIVYIFINYIHVLFF